MQESEKQEMRIRIAQDALKQINMVNPSAGVYCMFPYALPANESLQKFLIEQHPPCDVCALGSLFLSNIRINNKFNTDKINQHSMIGRDDILASLREYFDYDELDEIEKAFEGNCGERDYNYFVADYPEDSVRLELILNNIIDNKGAFKPGLLEFDEDWDNWDDWDEEEEAEQEEDCP